MPNSLAKTTKYVQWRVIVAKRFAVEKIANLALELVKDYRAAIEKIKGM